MGGLKGPSVKLVGILVALELWFVIALREKGCKREKEEKGKDSSLRPALDASWHNGTWAMARMRVLDAAWWVMHLMQRHKKMCQYGVYDLAFYREIFHRSSGAWATRGCIAL